MAASEVATTNALLRALVNGHTLAEDKSWAHDDAWDCERDFGMRMRDGRALVRRGSLTGTLRTRRRLLGSRCASFLTSVTKSLPALDTGLECKQVEGILDGSTDPLPPHRGGGALPFSQGRFIAIISDNVARVFRQMLPEASGRMSLWVVYR